MKFGQPRIRDSVFFKAFQEEMVAKKHIQLESYDFGLYIIPLHVPIWQMQGFMKM